MNDEKYICVFCGKVKRGWGNSCWPIISNENSRCCDGCNRHRVIPARIESMNTKENKNGSR